MQTLHKDEQALHKCYTPPVTAVCTVTRGQHNTSLVRRRNLYARSQFKHTVTSSPQRKERFLSKCLEWLARRRTWATRKGW
ncbi:hypothetical protein INR49_029843 [Caranx melampygus]|nr:hypothetical protein INR49_029843 [Caranx melampygus]